MTEKVVWHVVKQYAGILGVSKSHHTIFGARVLVYSTVLAANWNMIQFPSGHISVQTTEKYLGCKQRFREATRLGLSRAHETWS
jgi:hypothetical protein